MGGERGPSVRHNARKRSFLRSFPPSFFFLGPGLLHAFDKYECEFLPPRWSLISHNTQPVNISRLKKILRRDVDAAFVFLSSPPNLLLLLLLLPSFLPREISPSNYPNLCTREFVLLLQRESFHDWSLNSLLYLQNIWNQRYLKIHICRYMYILLRIYECVIFCRVNFLRFAWKQQEL